MHFDHLLFVFLYTFAVRSRAVARRVKVYRLPSGIDEFEVLDDNRYDICTETERATEFCAKHGAINVQNAGSCSNHEETLHCRCNSTKSTFLLHEGRCVNNNKVTRFLHGEISPGRRITDFFVILRYTLLFYERIYLFYRFVLSFVGLIIIWMRKRANENKNVSQTTNLATVRVTSGHCVYPQWLYWLTENWFCSKYFYLIRCTSQNRN